MCKKTIIKNLILIAAAFQKATGRSMTSVSKEFYGRGDFLENLKTGKHTISIDRLDRLLNDFRNKWPEGAAWPAVRDVKMSQNPKSE